MNIHDMPQPGWEESCVSPSHRQDRLTVFRYKFDVMLTSKNTLSQPEDEEDWRNDT